MSDNNENVDQDKTPEGPLQTDHGTTTIEENVVAKIAGMAARQVPGVYGMGNAVRRAFSAVTDRITTTQTNVTGGRRGQHRRHRRPPARGGNNQLRLNRSEVVDLDAWI